MLRLGLAVIGVGDMPRAVAFWTAALNLVASEEWRSDDWVTLHYADGSRPSAGLTAQRVACGGPSAYPP